jgi:crotonobetainyl-CoA:carnitine CoA-transferase CaiB-like acyl-CoA transferase
MNAGKRSVALNLSTDEGRDIVRRMICDADVLLHNLRPGRMDAMGLGGLDCLAIQSQLVYVALSGYGGIGPLGSRPGYDGIGQAFGGLTGLVTKHGDRPRIGPAFGDLAAGLVAMCGAVLGLYARSQTGRGQIVETSLIEAIVAIIVDQFGHLQGSGSAQDFDVRARVSQIFSLETADARHLLVHISTSEKFYRAFVTGIGRDDLLSDLRFTSYKQRVDGYDELVAELETTTRQWPMAHWEDVLADADVPHSPVLSVQEVLDHPQFAALDLFSAVESRTGIRLPGPPWRVNGYRSRQDRIGPRLGEHTEAVLGAYFDQVELEALRERGVVMFDGDCR